MLEFKKLELSSKTAFDAYTKNKYENSEASFANMLIWSEFYNIRYSISDGFLYVIFTDLNGKQKAYMPYGNGDLKNCIDKLNKYFADMGQNLTIVSADYASACELEKYYPDMSVTENIDFNDYVYSVSSLSELSGKKLHSKKNHLNKFKNTYDYIYREMKKDDFDKCIKLAERLMKQNRDESSTDFMAEYNSIRCAFDNFEYLELSGGVIEIDGNICAFSVGEELTDEAALIHIEKADIAYNGIYAAINNEFVKNRWSGFKYVNREEDMGLEGLRKAKMSYRPDHMVRKYICKFNSLKKQ